MALLERYRVRCQWHDRARLQALADEPGRREDRLRDDLARFLFDAGLNPLTEAVVGTVARADVLDPSLHPGFLLEARQYDVRTAIDTALRAAFRQALDTAGALGGAYAVDEAFIVLFRRGGPRALLPRDPLVADALRWHFLLIDLAPAEASPSRAREDPEPYDLERLRQLLLKGE